MNMPPRSMPILPAQADNQAARAAGGIEMRRIRKTFPANGVTALDGADIRLFPGTIHALLGENGAGKSTLMHILAGFLQADEGAVFVEGRPAAFRSPAHALAAGIGMVRQRPLLCPGLSVWEACVLGAEASRHAGLPLLAPYRRRAREKARALDAAWRFGLPLDEPSENLSAAERQLASILALLLSGARFLIFDEPTAVLGEEESARLYALWRRLASDGAGIMLISHKLEETLALASSFTVLRKGAVALDGTVSLCGEAEILDAMFGSAENEAVGAAVREAACGGRRDTGAQTILEARGFSVAEPGFPVLRDISFKAAAGEILGIAGVKESGTETLELSLAGFLRHVRGNLTLCGSDIAGKGPRVFRQRGGAYLSAGRKRVGEHQFITPRDDRLSLKNNLLIHAHRRFYKTGILGWWKVLDGEKVRRFLSKILKKADIDRRAEEKLGSLSGGMSQRALGEREFAEDPRLLLFAEPAWGLDRRRRERFFRFLRERADEGRAVILFFADLDDIVAACDRILVLRNGQWTAEIRPHGGADGAARLISRIKKAMAGRTR
jgi:simple sugar transport system ATP-binding protein